MQSPIDISTHYYHMQRAYQLAVRGKYISKPNPCVGCVIVKNGKIVSQGFHQACGSLHAEIMALKNGVDVTGATLYCTLEPCTQWGKTPPCTPAILKSGITSVIIGTLDPNPNERGRGMAKLQQSGITTQVGYLQNKLYELNKGFFKKTLAGTPWVSLKIALSADNFYYGDNSTSRWLSGAQSRRHSHYLRAISDMVVVGHKTYMHDKPKLTARISEPVAQPQRAIIGSRNQSMYSNLSSDKFYVYTSQKDTCSTAQFIPVSSDGNGRIDLKEMLSHMASKNYNHVLVECGNELAKELLAHKCIDEIYVYQSDITLSEGALWDARIDGRLYYLHKKINLGNNDRLKIYRIRDQNWKRVCLQE